MPAVQTCSTSVASKKLFISVYQLLKRLDYIPNGLWLSVKSILNRWKKINSATKMSLLASLLTGPYSLEERKNSMGKLKNKSKHFHWVLFGYPNTYKVKVWEATIYLFWPWPAALSFQCCFLFIESWSLGKSYGIH